MRCKEGDLAVVIRSDFPEDIGKFVKVVRRVIDGNDWYAYEGEEWECAPISPMRGWIDDEKRLSYKGLEVQAMHDADLRPLRDQEGEDETLTWTPLEKLVQEVQNEYDNLA